MRSALLELLHRRPARHEPIDDFADTQRPGTAGTRSMRLEVCPPQAPRALPWLSVLRGWFEQGWPNSETTPWQPRADPMRARALTLVQIKQEFADAVSDLGTPQGAELMDRIHFARSLHELWHLRADVFSRVAVHHSQEEAEERLAWLNRHFPTRSPRSGFGALNLKDNSKDMWP